MSHNVPLASASNFGVVKIGSGLSVSNGIVSLSAPEPMPTGYYGFLLSTTSETNPVINTANIVTFDTVGGANGVSVISGTRVTVANAGTYQGIFNCQLNRAGGGISNISIWAVLNGTAIPWSNSEFAIADNAVQRFVTSIYTATLAAGDYFQIYWSSPATSMQMLAQAAQVSPTRPATPACRFSVTQV